MSSWVTLLFDTAVQLEVGAWESGHAPLHEAGMWTDFPACFLGSHCCLTLQSRLRRAVGVLGMLLFNKQAYGRISRLAFFVHITV